MAQEWTDTERLETANAIACDRAYVEGCRVGYRLGLYEDRKGRDAVVAARAKDIREAIDAAMEASHD